MRASALLLPLLAISVACGARTGLIPDPTDGDADAGTLEQSGKVDLLFVIDNSGSMGDKQELLRQALPDLIDRLISPKCLDSSGKIVETSRGGKCTIGNLEFRPVPDIHVAIVSSSLGGSGSEACGSSIDRNDDDKGRLINRDSGGSPIKEAQPSNFLAWFPNVEQNKGNPKPPVFAFDDPNALVSRLTTMVTGVGERGCGFESQLESLYHFLFAPDPWQGVTLSLGGKAALGSVDGTILKQRHDFLRPDSLLGIVMITDENDASVDPLALSAQAWKYLNPSFPSSPTGAAPRPTSECATNPLSPSCQPCNASTTSDPACQKTSGFYTPEEDRTNARFFHIKQRFGADWQPSVDKYVSALTDATVQDRNGKACTNPIFAKTLPTSGSSELCKLPAGPRSQKLVYFALIGGVPHQLLQVDGTDPNSPQKATLTDTDWVKILGNDPLAYDFTGADPHMLESLSPRPGLPSPTSPNDTDPIHGREIDTQGFTLQYACTFPLNTPRDCTKVVNTIGCDCQPSLEHFPPLCDATTPTLQIRGKAYPTIRELAVARKLGDRATVSSICPIHVKETAAGDPLYGYRPAISGIIDAIRKGLVK